MSEALEKKKSKKVTENKEKVVSIRVSEEDYQYLKVASFMVGMNVSQFVRTLTATTINAVKLQEKQGAINLEDFKTI